MRKAIGTVLALGIGAGLAYGAGPPEALTVRLVRPDRQCERLIALFRGSRATDPAAALAAWKRATGDPRGLGNKAIEAAIAALNPETARELRTLHQAEIGLGFDPDDGRLRWYATLPRDDGTFAALATALVLTGGGTDAPYLGVTVDRLGPAGSAVVAHVPGVMVVAGSRDELPRALARARDGATDRPPLDSGGWVRLDPGAIGTAGPVWRRRVAEALRSLGCSGAEAVVGLEDDTLTVALSARYDAAPGTAAPIDPAWLDWVPASGALALAAVAFDPSAAAWDRAFAWADRVERADPARAAVAPLRTRLNLYAAAAGVRPEVDLWPRLLGLSGCILVDPEGHVSGALLALHADSPTAADRIAAELLPRLVSPLTRGSQPEANPGAAGVRRLARLSGRPLDVACRGATVLVGWGESALAACLDARAHPARSATAILRPAWSPTPPQRAGAFWPGRLRALAGISAATGLADAPPVLWLGHNGAVTTRDTLQWTGLRGLVRRFLDHLPLDPSP